MIDKSKLRRLVKDLPILEVKGIDEQEMSIVHRITDSTIDRSYEIVDPNGADLLNYRKNPVVLFGHNYGGAWLTGSTPNIPIVGRSAWQRQEGEAWISKTIFTDATEISRDAWNLARMGFMPAVSIGFQPKGHEVLILEDLKDLSPQNRNDFDQKREILVWRKWELYEYSMVPIPANQNAVENSVMAKALEMSESEHARGIIRAYLDECRLRDLEQCASRMEQRMAEIVEERVKDLRISGKDLAISAERVEKISTEVAEILTEVAEISTEVAEDVPTDQLGSAVDPALSGDSLKDLVSRAIDGAFRRAMGRVD